MFRDNETLPSCSGYQGQRKIVIKKLKAVDSNTGFGDKDQLLKIVVGFDKNSEFRYIAELPKRYLEIVLGMRRAINLKV